jgi:EAL domain-containing protein (putative c-di-GMP-specific phosphodiesterase class I)
MTAEKTPFTFNLPYNQSRHYWLAIFFSEDNPALIGALETAGLKKTANEKAYMIHLPGSWQATWKTVRDNIELCQMTEKVQVALLAGDKEPEPQEFEFVRKSVEMLDKLSDSLWLGEVLLEDRVVCYMQPVLDRRAKIFGYEAFARVEANNAVIGGGKIIDAGKQLNIEYPLDRYLHLKAISTFISSDLDGILFINLIPGFIHRPEKYLEGLAEAVKFNGIPPRQIVLDFTKSEIPSNISHLKAIFDYCHTHGYLLSLDDISSTPVAKKILETVRPDFIKLDIDLVRHSTEEKSQRTISELTAIAREAGVTVIAEGVETEASHQELLRAGVDLFQGYLFSPPVAVSKIKKAVG